MIFITPVDVSPGTTGSWQDVDVSAYIPADATGVVFHIENTSSTYKKVSWRNNGSTDDRDIYFGGYSHIWAGIGVDANRVAEIYISSTSVKIYLVGYYADDAAFFTNAVDKSLASSGSWIDIDISSDTGGDTAIGAVFETHSGQSTADYGFRKNGSTDDRRAGSGYYNNASIIGVDSSEICEGYTASTAKDFYLVGYILSDSTFITNATDLSLGSTGSYIDLSALPAGAIGGYIEIYMTSTYNAALRKNGSAEDIYRDANWEHVWAIVECDGDRIIEGKIENVAVDFFLIGYPTAATSTSIKSWNGLAKASIKSINGLAIASVKSINGLE